jgi:hypothetical protein
MFRHMNLALAALLVTAAPAIGGEDQPHRHTAQHGGVIVESGHHHLEVVAKDGSLEVYVGGEGNEPEEVKDATASATILSGGKKADIQLAPDAGNLLKGAGSFTAGKGTTIVITLMMPGHKPEQARVKLD